jgi:hypothetical protein
MRLPSKRTGAIFLWLTAYLWSVPFTIVILEFMEWQYDLDLTWWIVVGWTAPVVFLGSWFLGAFSKSIIIGVYFVILMIFTAYAIWLANTLRQQEIKD